MLRVACLGGSEVERLVVARGEELAQRTEHLRVVERLVNLAPHGLVPLAHVQRVRMEHH